MKEAKLNRVKSDAESALRYQRRKPGKHAFEMRMLAEAIGMLPLGKAVSFLDAPCGVGRMSLWLAGKGFRVTAVDLGEAAVEATRKSAAESGLLVRTEIQDVFHLSYGDRQFDAVLCFRLLHHFADEQVQRALIRELCRVAGRFVVISHFSPISATAWRRRFRNAITGKAIKQNSTSLVRLKEMFDRAGFRFLGRARRSGIFHSLQTAAFERSSSVNGAGLELCYAGFEKNWPFGSKRSEPFDKASDKAFDKEV